MLQWQRLCVVQTAGQIKKLDASKLSLRIQPARRLQGKKAPKRLDVSKLNEVSMRQDFINGISNQLGAMNHSSEDWAAFQNVVYSSAAITLRHPSRKHPDWFDENDEEIESLLEEKHDTQKAHQDDTSSV